MEFKIEYLCSVIYDSPTSHSVPKVTCMKAALGSWELKASEKDKLKSHQLCGVRILLKTKAYTSYWGNQYIIVHTSKPNNWEAEIRGAKANMERPCLIRQLINQLILEN